MNGGGGPESGTPRKLSPETLRELSEFLGEMTRDTEAPDQARAAPDPSKQAYLNALEKLVAIRGRVMAARSVMSDAIGLSESLARTYFIPAATLDRLRKANAGLGAAIPEIDKSIMVIRHVLDPKPEPEF